MTGVDDAVAPRPDLRPLDERLVAAGTEILEEEGLPALTLRAVARRAGVSHGAPRTHFPTFAALLARIAENGVRDLSAAVRTALAAPGDPEQKVRRAARAYREFAQGRPGMFALVFRHDLLADSGLGLRRHTLGMLDALTQVVAVHVPHPDRAREVALALWTQVHGVAVLSGHRGLEVVGGTGVVDAVLQAALHAHLAQGRAASAVVVPAAPEAPAPHPAPPPGAA